MGWSWALYFCHEALSQAASKASVACGGSATLVGDRGPAPQQNDKARGAMVMDEGAVHRQIFASRLINFYSIHDPSLMSTVDEKVRVAFMLYL